MFIYSN